jgi:poly-gamma-glutamate synthesis protein (capsule biosynthesis protein)
MSRYRIISALLAMSLFLGGCGMLTPIGDSAEPSSGGESSSGSTGSSAAETSAAQTETTPQPQRSPAELLAEQAAGVTSILPMNAEFLAWCTEHAAPGFAERLSAALTAGSYSDADFYALSGMTAKAANDLFSGEAERADNIHVLDGDGQPGISMTFTGDISFADNWTVMQYCKTTENGITDCISPFLVDRLRASDISCINNEFCFSDRGTPMAGKMYTFRAATQHVELYHTLGTDIVDLANNHCFDFGAQAFLDTLDTLDGAGIQRMGGGRDLAEASKPVYYIIEGKKIAFVAATRAEKNIMTPEATDSSPGVLRCYDPTRFLAVIKEAKAQADYVIANLHWGTENSHALEQVQISTAKQYIDAGADLIIGAHAHCLQGIEYYKHVPIVYNLGNFWFSHYDIDTGLLWVNLTEAGSTELTFYPATQRDCKTTYVDGEAEGDRILQCMRDYSINADFAADGTVTEQ